LPYIWRSGIWVEVQSEDSGIRQGKTYRIYSMTEILRRRRAAGYTGFCETAPPVELIKMPTIDKLTTVDKLPTVARRIISRCQGADHTATVEEIAYFAELKIQQLARRRNITNWPGLLMAAVPPYFDPPATELSRYRKELQQSRELERRREVDMAQATLSDPNEPEPLKQLAREILERWSKTVLIPGSGEPRG
jgi:hypothetical protein